MSCQHRLIIEVGHRLEKDRQPDGSVHRLCFVVARCRQCGAKLLQRYDMRRHGKWVEADDGISQARESA
jgi:hypothetical protein